MQSNTNKEQYMVHSYDEMLDGVWHLLIKLEWEKKITIFKKEER